MMKTLGQCSEPSPDLRVPLLQCRDKQQHRLRAENTLKMFFLGTQWTPVSHFQEPPGAERDEEPVPVTTGILQVKTTFITQIPAMLLCTGQL